MLTPVSSADLTIEREILLDRISGAVTSWLEHELTLDPEDRNDETMHAHQISAVLAVLDQLGLSLDVLAQINSQQAMVFPVVPVEHYKGGHYLVLGTGMHTETAEAMTIYYQPIYRNWYARPTRMFNQFVDSVGKIRFVRRAVRRLLGSP